jgi:predicted  nucleic acid-binding Zn-ribbon protein
LAVHRGNKKFLRSFTTLQGYSRQSVLMAEDWDDLSTAEKLEQLRSAVNTLERRQDDLLRHVSELADAVAAMELKLRQ